MSAWLYQDDKQVKKHASAHMNRPKNCSGMSQRADRVLFCVDERRRLPVDWRSGLRRWQSAVTHCLTTTGQGSSAIAAEPGRADGAHAEPGRAGLWPHRPGAAEPAAAPPANAQADAGIRGLGSSADSNAGACTCVRNLCAGRAAAAVVVDAGGCLAYDDCSPRERCSPKGQPGENVRPFFSGANQNRETDSRWTDYAAHEPDREEKA